MLRSSVRRGQVEADGTDFLVPFADGWGKDDTPFSVASCGNLLKNGPETMPDRLAILPLMADFVAIKTFNKAAKPPDYLCGRTSAVHFRLEPSAECVKDVLAYATAKRREPVREGGPAAPQQSALELGVQNDSFRVCGLLPPPSPCEDKSSREESWEDV